MANKPTPLTNIENAKTFIEAALEHLRKEYIEALANSIDL